MIRFFLCTSCFSLIMFACSGNRPANLGVHQGKLSQCPKSPNCVSSQSIDKAHYIEPLRYEGSLENAKDKLLSVIRAMKRARVVTMRDDYIHAEFVSALFRFVDDAEFLFDEKKKMIHIRSAARIGYWDLGVNRKRMERIRVKFSVQINE